MTGACSAIAWRIPAMPSRSAMVATCGTIVPVRSPPTSQSCAWDAMPCATRKSRQVIVSANRGPSVRCQSPVCTARISTAPPRGSRAPPRRRRGARTRRAAAPSAARGRGSRASRGAAGVGGGEEAGGAVEVGPVGAGGVGREGGFALTAPPPGKWGGPAHPRRSRDLVERDLRETVLLGLRIEVDVRADALALRGTLGAGVDRDGPQRDRAERRDQVGLHHREADVDAGAESLERLEQLDE